MTRFMDDIGSVNDFPNDKFAQWYANNRPIGIGIMGYADALLKMGIKYGSHEALNFLEKVMETIQKLSYTVSTQLGKERGIPEACKEWNRRNITTVSIAPTGSIAFIAGCSHSIEPIFSPTFTRTDERGETYLVEHTLADKDYFAACIGHKNVVNVDEHINTQAIAQKYCDSGISKTINFPENATVDDVYNAFINAWKLGCKGLTIYRDNSRQIQVLKNSETEKVKSTFEMEFSENSNECDNCGSSMINTEGCVTCPNCGAGFCSI